MIVVGWTDAFGNAVPTAPFTTERKKALQNAFVRESTILITLITK